MGVSVVRPRLDEKPWGGRRLERFGLALPPDARVGEALVTAGEAEIAAGVGAGATLGELVARDSDAALGPVARQAVGGRALFPLLIKLIDARENLSVQVHPNDEQAARHDRLGKSEAWHVLAAEPGAALYLGLREGVSTEAFAAAARRLDGSSAALLRRVGAVPGMTVVIPAGTVHALGAGVMVYEIQQPSDVTYRLDDWGRLDAAGNPREMHLDDGFAVMQPAARPDPISPVDLRASEGRRHLLTASRYFALERVALPRGGRYMLPAQSGPQVLTVLQGRATVADLDIETGQSVVVWPDTHALLDAQTPVVALRGWVPALPDDVGELAARTGADEAMLAALGSGLADHRDVLRR